MKKICGLVFLTLMACRAKEIAIQEPALIPEVVSNTVENKPLNILWIVAEDLGMYLPMFGDKTIETPNLSRLANEGICYDQFYTPAAVCAPARSSIALGLYPTHIGSNHMRTGPWYASTVSEEVVARYKKFMPPGMIAYEAMPPEGAKMMSEYLREAGYYCTNNAKQDYQFRKPVTAWDQCDNDAHWRNRKNKNQPFFSIFNLEVTHESQIWSRQKDSLWVDENLPVAVPPYLPDTKIGRRDVQQMYSNIKQMDKQAGDIIAQLEEDGLLDETIIFWYSDHGGPLPRQKRLLYDSGIKVPMIIRLPNKTNAGTRNEDLISFIDLAPTALSIAGLAPPSHMDGRAFIGDHKSKEKAKYVFAAADRFDESYDKVRAVKDGRYKLIKYHQPEKPMFLPINYREQMAIMRELHKLKDAGELNEVQLQWFRETKPEFEFFDTQSDPHEIKDLYNDEQYADKIAELKAALIEWRNDIPDLNLQSEKDLLEVIMPDHQQRLTSDPIIKKDGDVISVSTTTKGASIGYQINSAIGSEHWQVYTQPLKLEVGSRIKVVAHRLGYKQSAVVEMNI